MERVEIGRQLSRFSRLRMVFVSTCDLKSQEGIEGLQFET